MAESFVDRVIRRQRWLEPVGDAVQAAGSAVYGALGRPGRTLKNVLHGTTPFGHPLHPAVTDVPIGAWAAGVVADYVAHFTGRLTTEAGDIALAVTEATTNVARHAYPSRSEGTLDLCSRVEDRTLTVVIRDFGVGLEAQGANGGLGLGLMLMAKLTASWDVEPANPGTRITLRFALTE